MTDFSDAGAAVEPYLATPAWVRAWAENGDAVARRFLDLAPTAVAFGVDDHEIQIAFEDVYSAGEWIKNILAAEEG